MHNQYIRDNLANTPPAVFTKKGDLIVGSGLKTGAIFGVGTNNENALLRYYTGPGSSNNLYWSRNAPSIIMDIATQSIPDNTLTQLNLTIAPTVNPSDLPFYPGSGNYFLPTLAWAGVYYIWAQGYLDAAGTPGKYREISITDSLHGTQRCSACQPVGGSVQTWLEIGVVQAIGGGEQLSVNVLQISGGALNFRVGKFGMLKLE
jgi:hypothetical protein